MTRCRAKVLVIDDHLVLGMALKAAFEADSRFEVVGVVRTIGEALESLGLPDVVILDLCLPGLSGSEAVIRLREHARDVPVVVYSSAPAADLEEAKRQGADTCIPKGEAGVGDLMAAVLAQLEHPT